VITAVTTVQAGYFGPEGTFTHEALLAASDGGQGLQPIPFPTIYDTVMAVHAGEVQRALVPIENSLEGSVNATLDTLAMETESVAILGEVVHPIRHCLIARTSLDLREIRVVVSHPQASGQCARFIRTRLPAAEVMAGSSTAEAVRTVAAAERYGCQVLLAGVEDVPDNETRFVWLGRSGEPPAAPGAAGTAEAPGIESGGAFKTAIVFWGAGSESPGWLVACLGEFAARGVNLTRIESRPRKQGLGSYMFFADLDGAAHDAPVADSLAALTAHVETLRVLGSFPAA